MLSPTEDCVARSYIVYTNPHLTDSADDKHYHLIEKDQVFP